MGRYARREKASRKEELVIKNDESILESGGKSPRVDDFNLRGGSRLLGKKESC